MKNEYIICLAGFISIGLCTIAGFYLGRSSMSGKEGVWENKPTYNDGFKDGLEFGKLPQTVYPDIKEMVYTLCREKGIDVNRTFYLSCPKCGYAKFDNKEILDSGVNPYVTFGWLAKTKTYPEEKPQIRECNLHCGGCEYLFGNDWFLAGIDFLSELPVVIDP